jgi:hypothetical protein
MRRPAGGGGAPVTLLVDVERAFTDGRTCRTARSADQAIALLREYAYGSIDQLWLDYDLGWLPTSVPLTAQPIVDELVRAAADGVPYAIGEIRIHGRNPRGTAKIKSDLENAGYHVVREYDLRVLTRSVHRISRAG